MSSKNSRMRRVVVVGTGGTIAGSAAVAGQHYRAGVFSVEALLAAVPAVADVAEIRYEQLFNLDSVEFDLGRQLQIARGVAAIAAAPDVDGVVVTHGTDTMEETAYLLHLVLGTDTSVVMTGAMRAADVPGADGPANLLDAVCVAVDPAARGLGTLMVFGGQVHSGRDVSKRVGDRLDAFASDHGPLGQMSNGTFHHFLRPTRRFGRGGAFEIDRLPPGLPGVEILLGHPDLPAAICRAVVESGASGIVHAGPGAGNVSAPVASMLDDARRQGVVVVRASRTGAGLVTRDGVFPDSAHDWVAAGDLNPYKSRVLLALALTRTRDTNRIQSFFDTH